MMENWGKAGWILAGCAIIAILIFSFGGSSSNSNPPSGSSEGSYYEEDEDFFEGKERIDRYDAINDYWDEIKEYVSGTETIIACSWDSGNCYDLDAEIYNGYIELVYFPDGGYLSVWAEIDSDGEAYDYAQDGREWSFTFDMDSSLVDDALYEWADYNDYELE